MKTMLVVLIVIFLFNNTSTACEIRARSAVVSPDQKSLKYIHNENGSWTGLTIDLTKALLEEAGCTYSFHEMTWKRGLVELRDGGVDIMMNVSFTEEREKFAYYIGPMDEEKMVLVVQKNSNLSIDSFDDFKEIPAKISYERGAYLGKEFDHNLKTDPDFVKKFELFTGGDITNYRRLNLGRIGGIIADKYEVSAQLANYPKLVVHPFTINHDWVYWAMSRKSVSEETMLKLYQAYIRLKNRKALEQIVNRYAKLQ